MSGPVGPLLRATVRRMAGSAVSPDQLRLRLYSRNRLGERCVQDALAHVISDPTGAVRHLVAAAGYRQLLIAEKSGQAEPAVRGSVVTQETAGQFSDGALAAGDGLLTVNPFTYFNGQSQDRNDAVQHELWHLFMSKAFPGFAADLARLHKATRERVPYFR